MVPCHVRCVESADAVAAPNAKNDGSFVHGGFGSDAQDWEPRCTLDDATWFNSVITNRDNNVKATSEWDSKDAKTL